MANTDKRIIALTETNTLTETQYIVVDSEDGGTLKVPVSLFSGATDQVLWGGIGGTLEQQTDLKSALDDIKNNALLVDSDGYFYVIADE